jgi:hypothetical protein
MLDGQDGIEVGYLGCRIKGIGCEAKRFKTGMIGPVDLFVDGTPMDIDICKPGTQGEQEHYDQHPHYFNTHDNKVDGVK